MSVIPPHIESDIRRHLTTVLVDPESSEMEETYYLNKQDINLDFKIRYQKYHRKGQVQHGTEIIIRLEDAPDIVDTDVKAIRDDLENMIKSKLSYDGDFYLDDENKEYVFIEEIIQENMN